MQQRSALPLWVLTLFCFAAPLLKAAEYSAQIVDGLGRPIPDVLVRVTCIQKRLDSKQRREITLELRSNQDGMVRGKLDTGSCDFSKAELTKEGYESYSTGVRSGYVLERNFHADDLRAAMELEGNPRELALRELLAGDFSTETGRFRDLIFFNEATLRPVLRRLAGDSEVAESAIELLALIGVPEDLNFAMSLPAASKHPGFENRWRYWVAAALLKPINEQQWSFLRRCALNEFDDHLVDAGAIQTLKLISTPRSREILEEARSRNRYRSTSIARALGYIDSSPQPLLDEDLDALVKRVAQAIQIGTWKGTGEPRYNQEGDKALVDYVFHSGLDGLTYTATFHKIEGIWTLRGVREVLQEFAP